MKLEDIIALAKQGYKPNDIKDLVALAEQEPAQEEEVENEKEDEIIEDEDSIEDSNIDDQDEASEDEPDYKALYQESQQALKKAQQKNIQQKVGNVEEKSDEEVFNSFVQSFM